MSKMVKCKTCKQEIARTAKTCPHCGARQHQGVYAICTLILVLTMLLVVFVVAFSINSLSQPEELPDSGFIEVSAVDLNAAYLENTVNADSVYKGNFLEVSGTISNIGQDVLSKKPCVFLSTGDALKAPVQCFFNEADDGIASLRDGDFVTIRGKCVGYQVVSVQLSDCQLK